MIEKELFLAVKDPEAAFEALKPEVEGTARFDVEVEVEEKGLRLKISAKDPTAMKAALNSYTRLVKLINQVTEVE